MSGVLQLFDPNTGEVTFDGHRVTNRMPCPICTEIHTRQSWCLIDPLRGLAICPRVASQRKIGDAGWLHATDGRDIPERTRYAVHVKKQTELPGVDFAKMNSRFRANMTVERLDELSASLGLSRQSLEAFGAGWDGRCWSFPMWLGGRICGIRLRAPDRKFCVTGSRLGLFMPGPGILPRDGDLFICEGESDAAAMFGKGLLAVGRPGCKLAVSECCSIAYGRDAIIARDNDEPGRAGALELATELRSHKAKSVCVMSPPPGYKDFRAWINDGAEQDDIRAILKARRGW